MQSGFFILSFLLLCFDSLFPHLSLGEKKKAKFGTYTKMTAFSIMMFLKASEPVEVGIFLQA